MKYPDNTDHSVNEADVFSELALMQGSSSIRDSGTSKTSTIVIPGIIH